MRIKSVIQAARDKVNDPTRKYWSDAEIIRWVSHHHAMLYRYLANAHRSWGFHTFRILAATTDRILAVNDDTQRYFFPNWMYRLYGVRELSSGLTKRGVLIDYVEHPRDQGKGWYVSTGKSIDLLRFNTPVDIDIECSKLPPVLHYGTVDSGISPGRDEIVLASAPVDLDSNALELDWSPDAYVNAEIEIITDGTNKTDNRRGSVHQVVAQRQTFDGSLDSGAGRWVVVCTVRPFFPSVPQVGDTYELHLNLSPTNFEYLGALTARSLFHKTKNLEGIAAVKDVLAEGHDTFISGIRPRQEQQPGFMVDPETASQGHYNPDKDWSGEVLS
jgi:hypothetical protein